MRRKWQKQLPAGAVFDEFTVDTDGAVDSRPGRLLILKGTGSEGSAK